MTEMGISSSLLQQIKSGHKTVEGRLRRGKFLDVRVGDRIALREDVWIDGSTMRSIPNRAVVTVTRLQTFNNFTEMLATVGFRNAIPDVPSLDDALQVYRQFFTENDEKKFGVIAFSFELE